MTRYINKTWRIGPALLALACLLFLLAPQALAAEEAIDKGLDAIEIASDGTVTLVSGHAADEKIASVQFSLKLAEGDSLVLDPAFEATGKLTYTPGTGTQNVYIAGPSALMAPGQTRLRLGTVSSPDAAELEEGSLQYVYGKDLRQQTALTTWAQAPDEEPGGGEEPSGLKAQLQARLDEVGEQYTADMQSGYTEASWSALIQAMTAAQALLDPAREQVPTDEELQAALDGLNGAVTGLVEAGGQGVSDTLEQTVQEAEKLLAEIDRTKYTPESVAALQAAVDSAKNDVLSDPNATAEARATAEKAIKDAMTLTLIPDPSDPIPEEGETGGETVVDTATPAPTPTATPAPTATATAAAAAPNTGDETALLPWMAVLALSGGMLALLAVRRRQQR